MCKQIVAVRVSTAATHVPPDTAQSFRGGESDLHGALGHPCAFRERCDGRITAAGLDVQVKR
jgi:hypothetical protein